MRPMNGEMKLAPLSRPKELGWREAERDVGADALLLEGLHRAKTLRMRALSRPSSCGSSRSRALAQNPFVVDREHLAEIGPSTISQISASAFFMGLPLLAKSDGLVVTP